MTVDLAILDGRVVSGSTTEAVNLAISNGKIVDRTPHDQPIDARKVISARGQLVLPGMVDVHVHFREPGAEHKEGFLRGSQAAAAGGVTTVMIMPTDMPPTVTPEDYDAKVRLAEGHCHVDFAILAQIDPALAHVEALGDAGLLACEIFLAGASAAGAPDNELLLAAVERIAKAGMVAGITPGDDRVIAARTKALIASGQRDAAAFAASRPPAAEAFGVSRACIAAAEVGARVHIRQISCTESVSLLKCWKARAPSLTGEAMPHNLLLTVDDLIRQGPFAVMAPPLRSSADCESLWHGLHCGVISAIATDHAPHLKHEKEAGRNDIWLTPLGVPGLQTCLPLMLGEAARGRLSYEDVVRFTAESPARTFGIYPRKGALLPGSDADLVIVDPDQGFVIRHEDQLSRAGMTPFDGWKVQGVPVLTVLRGAVIMDRGSIVGAPRGALVTR